MGVLFGTDGIRGRANTHPITVETALAVGRAVAVHFRPDAPVGAGVVIGRDTRRSGGMLEGALVAGLCSAGVDAHLAGIMPTPGVAFHTRSQAALAGIVISASHNPYTDNGIKIFDTRGFKLSDGVEAELERYITDPSAPVVADRQAETGAVARLAEAEEKYLDFLKGTLKPGFSLKGLKLVLDCANGAAYRIAPRLMQGLGAAVFVLGDRPNGRNINQGCGSEHTGPLAEAVLARGAAIGLAFDGDADRLLAVDETGRKLNGEQILAICARSMQSHGRLAGNRVVTTVMSNFGLGQTLERMGIQHAVTDVGDRYVLAEMRARGAVLGGESSGHMIFLDHHTTGDGLLTGLQLLQAVQESGAPLSRLAGLVRIYPQLLRNVEVGDKPPLERVEGLQEAIRKAEAQLAGKGRVLVRYSGTQPFCRVMVEGPTGEETRRWCGFLVEAVQRHLG